MTKLEDLLINLDSSPPIEGIRSDSYKIFDFSNSNSDLKTMDMNNKNEFESYIYCKISESNSNFGIGKYAENRILYRRFGIFEEEESRSFHLGLDIWKKEETSVFAPLDGQVESFANNSKPGDYGPTIILKHQTENLDFYTLYGHLNQNAIAKLRLGQVIKKGEKFAELGDWSVNKFWPPHLHFQVIKDLYDYKGDFPGVCVPNEKERWMENSPNPNLLLKIPGLN